MMHAAGWRVGLSRRRPRNAGQRTVRQHVMRIERLAPCPPKELWWALIENAEATERGVMLRLALPGGVSQVAGKITRYESPTLLECCWDGNVLRWELEPRCEGTTHVPVPAALEERRGFAFGSAQDDLAHRRRLLRVGAEGTVVDRRTLVACDRGRA